MSDVHCLMKETLRIFSVSWCHFREREREMVFNKKRIFCWCSLSEKTSPETTTVPSGSTKGRVKSDGRTPIGDEERESPLTSLWLEDRRHASRVISTPSSHMKDKAQTRRSRVLSADVHSLFYIVWAWDNITSCIRISNLIWFIRQWGNLLFGK